MAIVRLQSETDKLERQYYEFDPETGMLGEGGMGVVYKGRLIHTDTGRMEDVAIKALYRDLPNEVVERALKEANIKINHDNVILMRGSLSLKENNGKIGYYIISEYLEGETLDKRLARSGKLSKLEALNIIKNVLAGLSALHNRNLVHRDIDPSNIMICKDGRVKIIDLGVVKDMNITGPRQTMVGQFIGKYEYASPEQLVGLQDLVKQTSDIYSTGIVLYELLAGRLPFTGTTYEITTGHKEKPIPLEFIPDKNLRKIVRKATAKKIEQRYRSAYEFIVDIEKNLIGDSRPIGNRFFFIAGIVGIVVIVSIGAFMLSQRNNRSWQQPYGEALSQASKEMAFSHYTEALDAYRKAYDIHKEDSIARKIESLDLLSQGMDAFNRSDFANADLLFRKAESLGFVETENPELLYIKGNMYRYGYGVAQSASVALDYYRKAAEKNYSPALYKLYVALSKEEPKQAMDYLTRSAKQGYVNAQSLLGRLLLEQHDKQGYEWLRQAADKNYPYALAQIGILYFDSKRIPSNKPIQEILGITGDDTFSQNYLKKALQYDSENYLANYGIGLYYYTDGNLKEAERYFKTAQKKISELYKIPSGEDELKYPNLGKIKDFIDYVVK